MASLAQGPPANPAPEDQFGSLRRENRTLKLLLAGCFMAGGLLMAVQQYRLGPPGGAGSGSEAFRAAGEASGTAREFLAVGEAEDAASAQMRTRVEEKPAAKDDIEIPEFFDTRDEWIGCGTFVVDQGQCGDCWAASAANTFGDRICIHLLEGGAPVTLPHAGARGAGVAQRMFQQAGNCIGQGTMGKAHEHGCERGALFVSPQPLVSCGNMHNRDEPTYNKYHNDSGYSPGHTLYPSSVGCDGGEAQDAWRFFYHEGLTIMDSTQQGGCTPYTSGLCSGKDPKGNGCHPCEFSQCADTGLKPERFTVNSFGWIMEEDLPARGSWGDDEAFSGDDSTGHYRPRSQQAAMDRQVRKMQIEMMTNGPLHTCMDDFANFDDFYNNYPQGIYNSTEGSPNTGGHCIELVGWGTDRATGMPYWTWKNSWGPNFANGGFARFIRGKDLAGIESEVWVGCPTGSLCKLTAGVFHNETWVPRHAYHPTTAGPSSTSAARPSRSWPGGREVELKRAKFEHPMVAPLVVAAVRAARGNPSMSSEAALAVTRRVWARSVRGLRVRVELDSANGIVSHGYAHRHMEGHVTAGF
ncbi:unnamed protein product [Prorocentrum cordatum]|uniref:Peptidase C1A papain C-terminal domain-containing protein n=1 Tax=Prorocentrum cordatum TaxID=2364126 RepID=A0ABN9WNI1_9DINO|nr:unnamed protein product [Polarella glacialis]